MNRPFLPFARRNIFGGMTQIALVTGANKGIGYETVRQLKDRGILALVGARDEERGKTAAAELDAPFVQLDVTDPESIAAATKYIEDYHGALDILINNAGVAEGFTVPSETSMGEMRRVFETNVFAVVAVTNAMLPLLRRSAAGRIVNVSSEVGSLSLAADRGNPIWELISPAYPASKTALNMVTLQYAKELIDTPIKVNMVTPGYCATDLNGQAGYRTAAQGAVISVRMALLPDDGPTGGFFNDEGTVTW